MNNDFFGAIKSGAEQYLKGLTEMGQNLMGQQFAQDASQKSWSEGMEQFAKLYAPANNNSEALFEQIMSQGKAFVGMLEKLYQAGKSDGQMDFSSLGQQWMAELSKNNPFLASANLPAGFGSMQWPNMTAMDPSMMDPMRALKMPAFGLNRESQERQQELLRHLHAYSQATNSYNALQNSSIKMAIERMQSKLAERSEPGRGLESFKAVYDLWIDSLEEAFAEVAMTSEYQAAYGNLVDAQMRVRANVQKQVELSCAQVGMPTRTELEGVHQKLADLRRRSRQEIAELKAELAEIKAAIGKSSVAKSSEAKPAASEAKPEGLLSQAKSVAVAKKAAAKSAAKVASKSTKSA